MADIHHGTQLTRAVEVPDFMKDILPAVSEFPGGPRYAPLPQIPPGADAITTAEPRLMASEKPLTKINDFGTGGASLIEVGPRETSPVCDLSRSYGATNDQNTLTSKSPVDGSGSP